jgi:glycosyltransferase involved in cell wall biosynthesis
MALGCPVITSNNAAILEATNLEGYSFNPDSPSDMIRKIENVLYSKTNINFLIKFGLDRVREFNWKNTSSKILTVYK